MEMFGSDWHDPNRFDLVLNLSKMRREGAKQVIVEAARLEEYRPTSASIQAFNDLALAARVHASLLASPHLQGSSLEVRAEDGHVFVKGRVDHGLEDEVTTLVKNVPDVVKVTTDLFSVPPEALLGA
jgi:osmotically-inducible protein OsmY